MNDLNFFFLSAHWDVIAKSYFIYLLFDFILASYEARMLRVQLSVQKSFICSNCRDQHRGKYGSCQKEELYICMLSSNEMKSL